MLAASVSHWIDRDRVEPLEWNALPSGANVRLSDWIMVREVSEVKGWARIVKLTKAEEKFDLATKMRRLLQFLERFQLVTAGNDVRQQRGQSRLSEAEAKLIASLQSALRWYNVGTQHDHLWDRFLAHWIALEAILGGITYPDVFQGTRAAVRKFLSCVIDQAPYPGTAGESPYLSPELLKNRLLASDWPVAVRLDLFARSMGIELASSDKERIRKLARLRGQGVHTGQLEIPKYAVDVESLSNLVERLLIASALCVYRQLEDDLCHIIDVYSADPAGGAATVLLDGREVGYEWREERLPSGDWRRELRIEGRVYDSENSEMRFHTRGEA